MRLGEIHQLPFGMAFGVVGEFLVGDIVGDVVQAMFR